LFSRLREIVRARFVADSPLEEDGFELSVPLGGGGGDRTRPSLASNYFHGSKHPNGQSKTAEAAVVKQQFDSAWARADTALTASAFF
jgi:hypothetical protein